MCRSRTGRCCVRYCAGSAGNGDCSEQHGRGHYEDGDGDLDLVLHFETQQTGIEPGDDRAALTGQTFDGHEIVGGDDIVAT